MIRWQNGTAVIRLFNERQPPLSLDGTGKESGGRRGSQRDDGIHGKGVVVTGHWCRGSSSQKSLVSLTLLEPSLPTNHLVEILRPSSMVPAKIDGTRHGKRE